MVTVQKTFGNKSLWDYVDDLLDLKGVLDDEPDPKIISKHEPKLLEKKPDTKQLYPKSEVPEFKASSSGISKQLADMSHAGTSFDPEKRARQEIDGFKEDIQHTYDKLKPMAKSDAQKELLNEKMAVFQSKMASKENDILASKGRTLSPMITGGSNFPTNRNRKALDAEHNKYLAQKEYEEKAIQGIKRDLKKLAVEEVGGELAAMKIKLEKAKEKQEQFKHINLIVRKKATDEEKIKMLVTNIKISEDTARKLISGKTKWDKGIPAYELTNNNANIHRMEERLKELETKENKPTSDLTFTGGKIIDNAEEDRIQIKHDQKPPKEILDKLKAEGWRWSPFYKAWQRKRTENAMYSAKKIVGII